MKRKEFIQKTTAAGIVLGVAPLVALKSDRVYKEGLDFLDFAKLCFKRGHRVDEETDDMQLFRTVYEIADTSGYPHHQKEIDRLLRDKEKEHLLMIGRSAIFNRQGGIVETTSSLCLRDEGDYLEKCGDTCIGCRFYYKIVPHRLKYMHSTHELIGRFPRESDGFYFEWVGAGIAGTRTSLGDIERYEFASLVRLCR